jgi:hypothetical protein
MGSLCSGIAYNELPDAFFHYESEKYKQEVLLNMRYLNWGVFEDGFFSKQLFIEFPAYIDINKQYVACCM